MESIHFMQKALLGGILIFTIELREPFLITKLHAIEYNRLHVNNSRAAINQVNIGSNYAEDDSNELIFF